MAQVDLGDLDLRTLNTKVTVEDGEWVLKVGDEDAVVTLAVGLNQPAAAILGAERLASAARELVEELRHRMGATRVR